MFAFQYACPKHRQMFAATLIREGCCDPEEMEKVRRRLLAWLSENYPRLVLEQFNTEACIGCAIENCHIDTSVMYDAILQFVRELASGAAALVLVKCSQCSLNARRRARRR